VASFEVNICKIQVEEHPNADALELAVVGGYRAIVQKGKYQNGDLVVYIPEQAVLPDWLISKLGLEGRLAGKQHNRVKAIRLRGILSQGLVIPLDRDDFGIYLTLEKETDQISVVDGDNVMEDLGIIKYVPPVPTSLSGEAFAVGINTLVNYDVENIKKFPDVLQDGEEVVMTEKLHGTFLIAACVDSMQYETSDDEGTGTCQFLVSSKGLAAKGLALKLLAHENRGNLYVKTFDKFNLMSKLYKMRIPYKANVYIMGEVYGKGVQDLTYGCEQNEHGFRVFDVMVTNGKGERRYLDDAELDAWCLEMELERVPVLYRGPYSNEALTEHTNGKDSISGTNVRKGVVVKPVKERYNNTCGRVALKSVSEKYLLRKGGTEYN